MEWWKLFGGTFILIFLAELGDKTQLAAMAKTADSPDNSTAKWVVFLAASLALASSTFIAVFLGHVVKSLVPDERYIKVVSGLLFLLFGFMILYEVFAARRKAEPLPAPIAGVAADAGYASRLTMIGAMEFESFTAERYRRIAERAVNPGLAELLRQLASEEERHLERLKHLPTSGAAGVAASPPADMDTVKIKSHISARVGAAEVLAELIRHEEATADFYQHLADRSIVPPIKAVFSRLAGEERGHARRLAEAMPPGKATEPHTA